MKHIFDTLYCFAKTNGYRVDGLTLSTLYQEHPMPGSLRCISDILDDVSIPHMVYSSKPGNDIAWQTGLVFEQRDHDFILSCVKRNDIIEYKDNPSVVRYWIIPISNADTRNNGIRFFFRHCHWIIRSKGKMLLAFFAIVLLTILGKDSLQEGVQLRRVLLGLGVFLSWLAVEKEVEGLPELDRFCRSKGKDSCKEAIHSSANLFFGVVSLGKLSLCYFLVRFIISLMTDYLWSSLSEKLLVIMTLPVICYSVIWQLRHQNLCWICSSIDIIIITEYVLMAVFPAVDNSVIVEQILWFVVGFCVILPIIDLIYSPINLRQQVETMKRQKAHLLAHDDFIWAGIHQETCSILDEEITFPTLNNQVKSAEHRLLLCINPSCVYCRSVIKALLSITQTRIDIVFAPTDDKSHLIARDLLAFSQSAEFCWEEALNYLLLRKGSFVPKSQSENNDWGLVENHKCFMKTKQIKSTPALFVDGRCWPDFLAPEDIRFVLY
jgi:hypothetical protein